MRQGEGNRTRYWRSLQAGAHRQASGSTHVRARGETRKDRCKGPGAEPCWARLRCYREGPVRSEGLVGRVRSYSGSLRHMKCPLAAPELPLGLTLLLMPASLMTRPSFNFFLSLSLLVASWVPLESLALTSCTVNHRKLSAKVLLLPSGQDLFTKYFSSTQLQSGDTGRFQRGLH